MKIIRRFYSFFQKIKITESHKDYIPHIIVAFLGLIAVAISHNIGLPDWLVFILIVISISIIIIIQILNKSRKDIRVINDIENLVKRKIPEVASIDWGTIGYVLNEKGKITGLAICSCCLKEVPRLEKLQSLSTLCLWRNEIKNISSLRNLKNLEILYLDRNQIEDISPLRNLRKLKTLYLDHNKIRDITPLRSLRDVKTLDLMDNPIEILPLWIVESRMEIQWNEVGNKYGFISFYDNPCKTPC